MSQPLSDDETLTRTKLSQQDKSFKVKRTLSFPFDVAFETIEEIAAEILEESQPKLDKSTSNLPSLSSLDATGINDDSIPSLEITGENVSHKEPILVSDSLKDDENMKDNEESSSILSKKRKFIADSSNQPPRKKRRIVTRARAARYTHLSDLINSGLLEVGEEITLKGQTGVVNCEGWIEYGDAMYPGAWTWCNAIKEKHDVSLSIPLNDSLNTQSEEQLAWADTIISGKEKHLDEYRDMFEKEDIFRKKIQAHKLKLLQKRRKAQRKRERERLGLPESENDIEEESDDENNYGELLPPSPLKSRLDEASLEESLLDEDEEFSIPKPKQTKRRRKSSTSPTKRKQTKSSPTKRTNKPKLPENDFSEWTSFTKSRKTSSPSKVIVTDNTVIDMIDDDEEEDNNRVISNNEKRQEIQVPDTEDFFSAPRESQPDSLNSLVTNLIHLADGTEPKENIDDNDVDMEDVIEPLPSPYAKSTPPNLIVNEDDEITKEQSQEWIQRRRVSPSSSPKQKPSTISSPSPSPKQITKETTIVNIPDSMNYDEEVLIPDSEPMDEDIIVEKPSYEESEICSLDISMNNNDDIVDNFDVQSQEKEIEKEVEKEKSFDDSGIKSSSAPQGNSPDKVYEEHEVFLIPSQPAPVKHQSTQEKSSLEQPLSTLADKWNKRKQYQKQLQKKNIVSKSSSPLSSPTSSSPIELNQEESSPMIENTFDEISTPATEPCTPQTIQSSPISSSPKQVEPLLTLAQQWDRRKETLSKSPEKYSSSSSDALSVSDELKQLESLENDESRKLIEKQQIEQSKRLKAALEEKERIKKLEEEKRIAEEKIRQDKLLQEKRARILEEKQRKEQQEKERKEKIHREQEVARKLREHQEYLAKQQKIREDEERDRIKKMEEEKKIADEKIREAKELARRLEIQKQKEKQEEEERRRKEQEELLKEQEFFDDCNSPNSLVLAEIDSVVALCHEKQNQIEKEIDISPTPSSTSNTISQKRVIEEKQASEREEIEEERREQEIELSQKLDSLLSSCSSLSDDMEIDNDLDNIPVRQVTKEKSQELLPPSSQSSTKSNEEFKEISSSSSKKWSIDKKPSFNESEEPEVLSSSTSSRISNNLSYSGPVILTSGLSSTMLKKIYFLVNELGGKMVTKFNDDVTHLVVLTSGKKKSNITRRTLKYSQAVLSGISIVKYDWILKSFQEKNWVDDKFYQIIGDDSQFNVSAPLIARKSISLGEKRLFNGKKFYLCGSFEAIDKSTIRQLISTGNGKIYSSLPKAPVTSTQEKEFELNEDLWFVICDGSSFDYDAAKEVYFSSGLIPISYEYLFDCISNYDILSKSRYQVLNTSSTSQQFQTQCSQAF